MDVVHRIHRLARLAKTDPNKRFDRLFREITTADLLMYAYEQIKDNKGGYTPGVDGKTKANWSIREAERVADMLRDGSYTPQPVRRVYIPKKSGKVRPLGIPTFTDRVVQSAIKIILEAIYEPLFRECSHGFRPGRGCYTALHAMYNYPKVRMDWVVEGDIKGFFDNVSHQILIRLLQKRIKDDRFLKLIAKFLKAGYFERKLWNPTRVGTPQGGIVSPILANIYLHEMDRYVEETYGANQQAKQTQKERYARVNPEYQRLQGAIQRVREMLAGKRTPDASCEELREQLIQLLAQRKHTPYVKEPIKPKITYARYADDWVIVLRNLPRAKAQEIKDDLTRWLWENLRLVLSPEKTLITHITDGFTFLGYKIVARKTDGGRTPKVKMVIPYEAVSETVQQVRELCNRNQDSEVDVIRRINAKLIGWMHYYACASAPGHQFQRVLHETFWAYGKYLGRKHKMYLSQAAKRWICRCPPLPSNPRGGQKTWHATTTTKQGKERSAYLVCAAIPRKSLHKAAQVITDRRRLRESLGD
jgi:group II intron reverse transcriptase/maturase